MPLYQFARHLLLRMPAGSRAGYAAGVQIFLDTQFFRAALYVASPEFYSRVSNKGFDYELFTTKEKVSIRKYVNRFCFRPTPFGLFASVTPVEWSTLDYFKMEGKEAYRASVKPEQAFELAMGQDLLQQELKESSLYEPNPSLYRVSGEYRFFRTGTDQQFNHREYQLQSIAYERLLKDLITFCRSGRTRQDIISFIALEAGCSADEGAAYFEFLADAQLLLNRLRPSIAGEDYLLRLLDYAEKKQESTARTARLKRILGRAKLTGKIQPGYFHQITTRLERQLPKGLAGLAAGQLSVVLHCEMPAATLDRKYQQPILDGLYALDRLLANEPLPAMEQFIKDFRKHFEGQSLPLLKALDPEAGIGYQQPARQSLNRLLETLHISDRESHGQSLSWTAGHAYLLECWHSAEKNDPTVIHLEREGLEKLQIPGTAVPILGLSVLFRIINARVYLETAGGVNAPALMGRFTTGHAGIHESAKEMAQSMEANNPDILFAELLQLSDPHTDNINQRAGIWSWELPLTAASAANEKQQLQLSDLFVSVENNKVVLRSARHGKVVIPRLTSAYNHHLNKLPLFRFLADLPYQYGKHHFGLDLRQFFPGLSFYPRVEYKAVILHLATWVITEEQLHFIHQAEAAVMVDSFWELSRQIKLPCMFSLAEGDQQLVFNLDDPGDVLFFASCIKQKKEVILKEFLPDPEDKAVVKDYRGCPMLSQFNAYLIPVERIPIGQNQRPSQKPLRERRKFIPGSEWLYLKIYTQKVGAGRLLLQLRSLVNRKYAHGKIKKWFFVRYEDHAPHIRLRLYIAPSDLNEILLAFKGKLEGRIHQHIIREYQIDVYNRELERYRLAGIVPTEDFFCASSELALGFLRLQLRRGEPDNYQVALVTVRDMLAAFLPDMDRQLQFTSESYQGFLLEFDGRAIKAELDKKYRELRAPISAMLNDTGFERRSGSARINRKFRTALRLLRESIGLNDSELPDYLRSIIHLHLNRIFTDEARKQEMIIYYLLHKYLLAEKGKKRSS